MIVIVISLAASLGFLGALAIACRRGAAEALAVAFTLGFLGMLTAPCVLLVAFFVQTVLTFVALLGCAIFRATPKTRFGCCLGAMLAAYGWSTYLSVTSLRELRQLREEYPVVSLADRLDYEKHRGDAREANASGGAATHPEIEPAETKLSAQVSLRLDKFEERGGWTYRQYMLRNLHDQSYELFAASRGFGVSRMSYIRRERIELPDDPPVELPEQQDYIPGPSEEGQTPPAVDLAAPPPAMSLPSLQEVHDAGVDDFLDPERFGYVERVDRVTGFASHRFSQLPLNGTPGQKAVSRPVTSEEWDIRRLELVSLLKHDTPRVYVSEHLPRMDELNDAPTRPLTPFETDALAKLRRDEDLVVHDPQPGRVLMLGAVRAAKQCLKCHSVERGELLGAFSYELVSRLPGARQAAPKPARPAL